MDMVICPSCHKKTPQDIGKCVRCGGTINTKIQQQNTPTPTPVMSGVVTIEATSKSIKGRYLAATALCCLGIVLLIAGDGAVKIAGAFAFLFGIIWYFVTRFRAWWHHG